MRKFTTHTAGGDTKIHASLTLAFDLRQRSRLRTRLDNGEEAALYLQRGLVLRDGDCLCTADGFTAIVRAAPELVSTVHSDDPTLMARACYHLGNRHVPLQVANGWARYLHDHVLDEMVRGLGLTVISEQAPFEPEAGAYGKTGDGDVPHNHRHD